MRNAATHSYWVVRVKALDALGGLDMGLIEAGVTGLGVGFALGLGLEGLGQKD